MATREVGQSSIRGILDGLKEWLAHNTPRLSEADTKAGLIDKYLAALGYREFLDIQREYPVKGTQERIDYVLKDNGRPILAVEAKALQHDLSNSKAAAQLVQYCSVEGIEWCALTNGIELRFYNQFLQQPLEGKLVFKLNLLDYSTDAEFDAIFDHLWLLSRESITTPTGLRAWMEHQQIDKEFRSVLLDPNLAPVEYLRKMMSQRGQNVSTEAIVQWFRSQLTSRVTQPQPQDLGRKDGHTTIGDAPKPLPKRESTPSSDGTDYWVVPAGNRKNISALDTLRLLLAKNVWGMGQSTPGRKHLKEGDQIAFYASKTGVVATAEMAGPADQLMPDHERPKAFADSEPLYRVPLRNVRWLKEPVPVDASMRQQLDAYRVKSLSLQWGGFIQTTRRLSEHDFRLLTASPAEVSSPVTTSASTL